MKQDTRGSSHAMKALTLVVLLAVGGIVAAVGIPVAVDAISGNTTTTLTQDVNTDYDVNGALVSNVTGVTISTTDTATVELNDTRTSGTTSQTIDNGSTADYDLEGGTVTVGVEDADDSTTPNQATVNYTYTKEYAYSSGASSLWGLLGLAIVLTLLVYFIAVGVDAADM